jgi:hypothetical protein
MSRIIVIIQRECLGDSELRSAEDVAASDCGIIYGAFPEFPSRG